MLEGLDVSSESMVIRLDFGIVLTMWYFIFYHICPNEIIILVRHI